MFDQVCCNFEFGPNGTLFYLPENTNFKEDVSSLSNDVSYFSTDSSEFEVAKWCEAVNSLFSMASVSSYGRVTRPGSRGLFNYGIPLMSTLALVRPPLMKSTIDDTFNFVRGHHCKRLNSDASSFSFNLLELSMARRRSIHQKRYRDLIASVTSLAPSIS